MEGKGLVNSGDVLVAFGYPFFLAFFVVLREEAGVERAGKGTAKKWQAR